MIKFFENYTVFHNQFRVLTKENKLNGHKASSNFKVKYKMIFN